MDEKKEEKSNKYPKYYYDYVERWYKPYDKNKEYYLFIGTQSDRQRGYYPLQLDEDNYILRKDSINVKSALKISFRENGLYIGNDEVSYKGTCSKCTKKGYSCWSIEEYTDYGYFLETNEIVSHNNNGLFKISLLDDNFCGAIYWVSGPNEHEVIQLDDGKRAYWFLLFYFEEEIDLNKELTKIYI